MSEFEIINWLKRHFGKPIGDDCADIRVSGNRILLTVDEMVENIHFSWEYFSPQDVGYKAVCSACSDISAMGGKPLGILVALGLADTDNKKIAQQIFDGIKLFIKPWKIKLLGGNITRSPSLTHITTSVVGTAKNPIYRSGAKPGEKIWVTGQLGGAIAGFILLTHKPRLRLSNSTRGLLLMCHKRPVSRIKAGEMIGKLNARPSAMIDISDGFFQDLMHILTESRVGAKVEISRLPILPGVEEVSRHIGENPYILSARSGEEYELLFTADNNTGKHIERRLTRMGILVTCVGEIIRKGIYVTLEGKPVDINAIKGWEH